HPAVRARRLAHLPAPSQHPAGPAGTDRGKCSLTTRAWASYAAISVLWGIPYLFISVAVDHGLSPAFLAFSRVLLGAMVLVPIAWRLGLLPSLQQHRGWLAVYALVEIAIPFPLIAFGEKHVSSSVAAILIAASPL